MLGITQEEVRRHPRWREELRTPMDAPQIRRAPRSYWLAIVGALIVVTALAVLILQG